MEVRPRGRRVGNEALGPRQGQFERGLLDIYLAENTISEPEWPDLKFWDLIQIAFRDHLVDRADHPVIGRLRGRAV